MTATNFFKKKVKPTFGHVFFSKALRGAVVSDEETFRMIRFNAESGENVGRDKKSYVRGLVTATAIPSLREDGLATWQRLAAAKMK